MQSHVNHEGAVTVVETSPLVLLVLTGDQYELLLYTAHSSINLPKLQDPVVSRTRESPPSVTKDRESVLIPTSQVCPFVDPSPQSR